MTLARDQKRNFSPRRPSFWAKKQFGACGEGHFAPKTGFRSRATLISRQKQDFAPKRGAFHWFRVHVGLDRGNKRRFRVHVPHKNTPGDHVALTLHGRPVTQTGNQRIMERYEFSETEKQLLQALSKNKKPEELEQQFDKDVLEAHLNRLQKLEMAVAHFSEDGVVAAWLTPKGSAYMKENPRMRNPVNYQWVMAMIALLSLIVAFLAWVTRCGG